MNKFICLLALIAFVAVGCGGEPEESPAPTESAPASDTPKSTDDAVVATDESADSEVLPEPFELAVATQEEIAEREAQEGASDDAESRDEEPADADVPEEVEEISSTGTATVGSPLKFLTVEENTEEIPGFEWVNEEEAARKEAEMKAQQEAEEQAGIEAAENNEAIRNELEAMRAQQEAELAAMKAAQEKAEQERMAAEAAAEEARIQAEADALAKKEAQEELERLKAEAEAAKMAAEAAAEEARKQAEADAMAKKQAQEELERIQAETEKQRMAAEAAAEDARKQAEAEALAKKEAEAELARVQAEAEAALLKAKQAEEMAAAKDTAAKPTEPAPEPESELETTSPEGSIVLAKLDLDAQENGVPGVGLGSEANIEQLRGEKVELAAYFFDAQGNPLQDSDSVFRSSRGQVYVGKESIVPADEYSISDTLFIPFDQLELEPGEEHEVQVELVLWEYSQGRGRRLAASPKARFTHRTIVDKPTVEVAMNNNITGTWKHEDSTITIVQQGNTVIIDDLSMIRNKIISEQWSYENGTLQGTVISKRSFPSITRVWNFNLTLSDDGNTLTGEYNRTDKKGNDIVDSDPVTWTRLN